MNDKQKNQTSRYCKKVKKEELSSCPKDNHNKQLSSSNKEDQKGQETNSKKFINDSYIQITQDLFEMNEEQNQLLIENLQLFVPFINRFKVILVNRKVFGKQIRGFLSEKKFIVFDCYEHFSEISSIIYDLFIDKAIFITTPKIFHHLCLIDIGIRSRISFIAIFNADKVFDEYFVNGSDSFFKLMPKTTSLYLFCSQFTFHVCLFCERYLNKYKIYGIDEKVIPNFIYHQTFLLLSFDDKISFLYETLGRLKPSADFLRYIKFEYPIFYRIKLLNRIFFPLRKFRSDYLFQ